MMRKTLIPLALVVVGVLFLFGWATLTELEAADPTAEPTTAAPESAAGEEVKAAETEEADSRFPLPAPTQAAMASTDDSGCITCHTSQKDLKELAKEPEEEGESLSEGEG